MRLFNLLRKRKEYKIIEKILALYLIHKKARKWVKDHLKFVNNRFLYFKEINTKRNKK